MAFKLEEPFEFEKNLKNISFRNIKIDKEDECEADREERADKRHFTIVIILLFMISAAIFWPLAFKVELNWSEKYIDYLLKIAKTLLFEVFLLDIARRLSKNIWLLQSEDKKESYINKIFWMTFIITLLLAIALVWKDVADIFKILN